MVTESRLSATCYRIGNLANGLKLSTGVCCNLPAVIQTSNSRRKIDSFNQNHNLKVREPLDLARADNAENAIHAALGDNATKSTDAG
jgi:hypothetical protein